MDINSVSFVKAFHDRLVEAGYSEIHISNREDGTCRYIPEEDRFELIDDGTYAVSCYTPFVDGCATRIVFHLTRSEMDEIPHNVSLDYDELEKYFGRSFDLF